MKVKKLQKIRTFKSKSDFVVFCYALGKTMMLEKATLSLKNTKFSVLKKKP